MDAFACGGGAQRGARRRHSPLRRDAASADPCPALPLVRADGVHIDADALSYRLQAAKAVLHLFGMATGDNGVDVDEAMSEQVAVGLFGAHAFFARPEGKDGAEGLGKPDRGRVGEVGAGARTTSVFMLFSY